MSRIPLWVPPGMVTGLAPEPAELPPSEVQLDGTEGFAVALEQLGAAPPPVPDSAQPITTKPPRRGRRLTRGMNSLTPGRVRASALGSLSAAPLDEPFALPPTTTPHTLAALVPQVLGEATPLRAPSPGLVQTSPTPELAELSAPPLWTGGITVESAPAPTPDPAPPRPPRPLDLPNAPAPAVSAAMPPLVSLAELMELTGENYGVVDSGSPWDAAVDDVVDQAMFQLEPIARAEAPAKVAAPTIPVPAAQLQESAVRVRMDIDDDLSVDITMHELGVKVRLDGTAEAIGSLQDIGSELSDSLAQGGDQLLDLSMNQRQEQSQQHGSKSSSDPFGDEQSSEASAETRADAHHGLVHTVA